MRVLFAIAALFLATTTLQAQRHLSLNSDAEGVEWQVEPIGEGESLPAVKAVVPGCVFTSYVEAGVEEDPNFGDNVHRVDKRRYDRDFLYTCRFTTPSLGEGERLWLNFEGVNRKGKVYLNDTYLGLLDGFMQRGKYDITPLVKADNVLRVEVEWVGHPVPNFRSPTYIASASWDWMPYVPGLLSGITDDVFLTTSGDVTLQDPWVRTHLARSNDKAFLTLQTEVQNHSAQTWKGVLRGEIEPLGIRFEQDVTVEAGKSSTVVLNPRNENSLVVENPALWWPNGMGEPVLHDMHIELVQGEMVSDADDIRFGIRQYGYEMVDGIFQLKINGEPVYVKGGNWGMSEWLLRSRGEEYDLRIALHRHLNYNMIRNWIGSVTDEEFYDACDRYGIMVWDDFWLNSHRNLPHDLHTFHANAIEKIKRLRNHASIAVWCGDNEGVPEKPLDDWMRGDVAYYDGGDRHYQSISNSQGLSGSGPWTNMHPSWYFTPYPMMYGYKGRPEWGFRTEIGTAVFTTFESFRKFMPEDSWWPRNEMWNKHYFGPLAANAGPDRYEEALAENYGEPQGIEDFCRKAQLLNLEVNKAMYEGWQHHLWQNSTGIMTWMSQSAYPSLVWQTYDYYFDPTGAYWGVRKACEHIHIQWSHADDSVRAVNTTLAALDFVEATAKVYDLDGRELTQYSQQLKSSLSPNSVQELFTLNFSVGNLARGAKVRASSTSRDAQRASAVTDGKGGTRWASEYNDAEWIELDLGRETTFNEIVLKWEGAHATVYRILLSQDGAQWHEVHAEQECKGGEQHIAVERQAARYVKVECSKRATQWGYSLYEIELYNRDAKTPQLSPVHFIRLELKDAEGKLLSENFYWRATERGNYQALNTLAPAKLKTTTRLITEGERKIIRTTVRNVGRGVAFAIHIQPRRTSDGERILPYVAEDNYITLLPGESRTLNFEFDGELLPDDRYSVDVKAYNN